MTDSELRPGDDLNDAAPWDPVTGPHGVWVKMTPERLGLARARPRPVYVPATDLSTIQAARDAAVGVGPLGRRWDAVMVRGRADRITGKRSKLGDAWVTFDLVDDTGRMRVHVFPRLWSRLNRLRAPALSLGTDLTVQGRVSAVYEYSSGSGVPTEVELAAHELQVAT